RPVRQLAAAVGAGHVVVVTVSNCGSYALLLSAAGLEQTVSLPEATPTAVTQQTLTLLQALDDCSADGATDLDVAMAGRRIGVVLGWLWDAVTAPVADSLGITGQHTDGQTLPRLWWCVSGLMAFLPLHAAGHHRYPAASAAAVSKRVNTLI